MIEKVAKRDETRERWKKRYDKREVERKLNHYAPDSRRTHRLLVLYKFTSTGMKLKQYTIIFLL